jgi:hypothetical protein
MPIVTRVCLGVFLVALCLRFGILFYAIPDTPLLGGEPQRIALSLTNSGTYANPFLVETGYTAHIPPVQPFLLSLFYRSFGYGPAGQRAVQISVTIIGCLAVALVPLAVEALGLPWMVGLFAGLVACWPAGLDDMRSPFGEQLSALLLLLTCILTWKYGWGKRASYRVMLAQALLWGLLFLLNTAAATILVALLAVQLFWPAPSSSPKRDDFSWTVVSLVGFCVLAVVSGWCLRNYYRLDAFVIRSNLGMELHMGNNHRETLEPGIAHPNTSMEEALLVRRLGEAEYNRLKLEEALTWMRANPQTTASLTLQRIYLLWFPKSLFGRSFSYPIILFTALSFAGFVQMWRERVWAAVPLTAIQLVFLLIYYMTLPVFRYRYPIYWITLIGAAYALYAAMQWVLRSRGMSLEQLFESSFARRLGQS